jgi:hypothetical protein
VEWLWKYRDAANGFALGKRRMKPTPVPIWSMMLRCERR